MSVIYIHAEYLVAIKEKCLLCFICDIQQQDALTNY
jgi:hypothetical protein